MVHPSAPEYVGIEFKVWAPQLTRVTKSLHLLGSLKELGAWNIDKALKAFPTPDLHVWKVEASLPAMSHFEWVWLTTNLNRGDVRWERSTKRNRTIDCFSGIIHTIWGDGDEVFLQSATCLEVTTFLHVDEGSTLVLTGSTPSAGEWNLHHAKPATEFPKHSGYWKIHVAFDALTNLEFKWAVVKEKDHGVLRMQEKLPHSIFGRRSWMRAVAPWNTPIVVVVDTPLLCDLTDTMRGRTDVIVKARKKRAEEIKTWLLQAENDKSWSVSGKQHNSRVQPAEKPATMAQLSLDTPLVGVASSTNPTPTFSNVSMLARAKTPDPDDVKDRDVISASDKRVSLMYKKYKEDAANHAINGRGQRVVPTDKMNIGDFEIGANMESSMMYGDVAEITAKHVVTPANLPLHTVKCNSPDKQGRRQKDKVSAQTHNGSLTSVVKNQETPLPLEGEHMLVKGSVCFDNDSNDEGMGLVNEVTPLQVLSQTVAETMPSDTGFTEMSSGVKTNATNSESALVSSQTTTYALAAEANIVSDGEDSRSDPANLEPHRSDNLNDGMVSFWELQQHDLTPPWLDKDNGFYQGGSGDLEADNLAAWKDDDEHLQWLASKIEEYEEEEEGDVYCNYTTFRSDLDDALSYSTVKFETNSGNENLDFKLKVSVDQKKRFESSSLNSLRRHAPPRKTIEFKDEQQLQDAKKQELASSLSDFDHLHENYLTPQAILNLGAEEDAVIQKRLTARAMEEQWGASYMATEGTPVDVLPTHQPPKTYLENTYSVLTAFAEGSKGLLSFDGNPRRMAYYSLDELSDIFLPDADFTNHREKAHELEIMWGESQNHALHVK
ncbi:hypothetical protein BsWGS_08176 [Bradybaena similaris]